MKLTTDLLFFFFLQSKTSSAKTTEMSTKRLKAKFNFYPQFHMPLVDGHAQMQKNK